MARNYFYDSGNVYTHWVDYPDGVVAPNATTVAPGTLEEYKWAWDGTAWNEMSYELQMKAVRSALKSQVNTNRSVKIYEGCPYTFPDGDECYIQTRGDSDMIAITSVVVSSIVMVQQGITDSVVPFRDALDETHIMTPSEAITMGMTVQQYISGVYQKSWSIKEQLEACTTVEELYTVDLTI